MCPERPAVEPRLPRGPPASSPGFPCGHPPPSLCRPTTTVAPPTPTVTRHRDIFEEIVRLRREDIPATLATIVGTRGSTPGRTSMRLVAFDPQDLLQQKDTLILRAEALLAAFPQQGFPKPVRYEPKDHGWTPPK